MNKRGIALGWVVDHIIIRMLWSTEIDTEEENKDDNDNHKSKNKLFQMVLS